MFGYGQEMRVAGRQLRPGVADPDDRPAVELILRETAILHTGAVDEAVLVLLAERGMTVELLRNGSSRRVREDRRSVPGDSKAQTIVSSIRLRYYSTTSRERA